MSPPGACGAGTAGLEPAAAAAHLADSQDELIERLEAPYAPRIQRAVRDVLNNKTLAERDKASQLLALSNHLGLARQPAPEPLPPIDADDIHQICWTAIIPAELAVPEVAEALNSRSTVDDMTSPP